MAQAQTSHLRGTLERLTLPREGLCRLACLPWFERLVVDKYVRVPLSGGTGTSGLTAKLLRIVNVVQAADEYAVSFTADGATHASRTHARLCCLDYANGKVVTLPVTAVSNSRPNSAEVEALIKEANAACTGGNSRCPPLPSASDAISALQALNRTLADADRGSASAVISTGVGSGSSLWGTQQNASAEKSSQGAIDGFLLDGRHRVAVVLRSWLAQDVAVDSFTPPPNVLGGISGGGTAPAHLACLDASQLSAASDQQPAAQSSVGAGETMPREIQAVLSGPPCTAVPGVHISSEDGTPGQDGTSGGDGSAAPESLLASSARPERLHRGLTSTGIGSGPGRRLERAAGSFHYLFLHRASGEGAQALAPPCVIADARLDEGSPELSALRLVRQFFDEGATQQQLRESVIAQLDIPIESAPPLPADPLRTPSMHPARPLRGPLQVFVLDADLLAAARGPTLLSSRGIADAAKALADAAAAASAAAAATMSAAPDSGASALHPSLALHASLHQVKTQPAAALYVRRLTQRHGRVAAMVQHTAGAVPAGVPIESYYDGVFGSAAFSGAVSGVSTSISPSGAIWVSESQLEAMVDSAGGSLPSSIPGHGQTLTPALLPWLPAALQLGPTARRVLGRVAGRLAVAPETAQDARAVCEAVVTAYRSHGMFVPSRTPPSLEAHTAAGGGRGAQGGSSAGGGGDGFAGKKRGREEIEGAGASAVASQASASSPWPHIVAAAAGTSSSGEPREAAPAIWCPALFPRRSSSSGGASLTLYHGTSNTFASVITSEGGPRRPLCRLIPHKCAFGLCDCQMNGFGVYLADRDKATMYALRSGNRDARDPSHSGAVLRFSVDVGVLAVSTPAPCPCGCARPFLDHHGSWYASGGCDTLYVRDNSWPATNTAEWTVADPARVRLDGLERVAPGAAADASSGGVEA